MGLQNPIGLGSFAKQITTKTRTFLIFFGILSFLLLTCHSVSCTSIITTPSQNRIFDIRQASHSDINNSLPSFQGLQDALGWPQKTHGVLYSSPALGDIDGDDEQEIIIGSGDGKVYIWHHNGVLATGWPQRTGGSIKAPPAIEDLNFDGLPEIIVGSSDGNVYIWHHNGTLVNGWPQQTGSSVLAAPVIGDLNGDRELEIICSTFSGYIYVWHIDGTRESGWPQKLRTHGLLASPAVGDLDGDGNSEIIIGTGQDNPAVYALQSDGALFSNCWPNPVNGSVYSSCAIGDLDSDPTTGLEIVVGTSKGQVTLINSRSHNMEGWPQQIYGSATAPVLGDLDGDGRLDIVLGSSTGKLYAWDANGQFIKDFPHQTGEWIRSSPVLGDIDGDSSIDVVVGSSDGLHIFLSEVRSPATHHCKISHLCLKSSHQLCSTPALGDLDQDGKGEIVIGSLDEKVYVWNTNCPFDARYMPWSMYGGNLRRTGIANDVDGDGLCNWDELEYLKTNPLSSDSDHDGYSDLHEIFDYSTNPLVSNSVLDSDGDGLSNVQEIVRYHTDPLLADLDRDSDGDGLSNVDEIDQFGTNWKFPDSDRDLLSDGEEIQYGTNPLDRDTDGDRVEDYIEICQKTDPTQYTIVKRSYFKLYIKPMISLGIVLFVAFILLKQGIMILNFTILTSFRNLSIEKSSFRSQNTVDRPCIQPLCYIGMMLIMALQLLLIVPKVLVRLLKSVHIKRILRLARNKVQINWFTTNSSTFITNPFSVIKIQSIDGAVLLNQFS